jgi:hypothetical protein
LTCEREQELLAAIAAGRVPDELRQHAASCAGCSETLLVASFLRCGAAEASAALSPLPDPGYLWWRASLQRRSAVSERATRVITIVQRAAVLSAALLLIPLLRAGWPHLRHWLAAFNPAALAPALPSNAANPGLVIAVSATLLAVLALLDLHGEWSRD